MKQEHIRHRVDFDSKETSPLEEKTNPLPLPPGILLDFNPKILEGHTLNQRFLVLRDLTENSAADKGGIGLVYLAEDLKLLGKKVVIKILSETSLSNDDLIRKFEHEKEALIRLDHPNVVKILDTGVLGDGNPYMVMEYIHGYSLRSALAQRKKLPFEFCAHVIESVGDALFAAHSKKILHRDVKPENIMLTPREGEFEHVRLIDFGIARVRDSMFAPTTRIERGIGTVLYVSPEQLMGKIEQNPSTDIYSCATVAYEMLTGRVPFVPRTSVEMFLLQKQGVETKPSELRPEIPAGVERIILQALSFEPGDRPQNARVFTRTLAHALREAAFGTSLNDEEKERDRLTAGNVEFDEILTQVPPRSVLTRISKPTEASIIPNKTDFDLPEPLAERKSSRRASKNSVWLGSVFLLIFTFLSIGGLVWWKSSGAQIAGNDSSRSGSQTNSSDENLIDAAARHRLSYFLTVQKMRSGKPFEEPFRASGREIFESGYKFKMVLESDAEGYLYLFNEGKDRDGKISYYLLHPTSPQKNSEKVKADYQVETGYQIFSGGKGTEIVWIIWSRNENAVLSTAKDAALAGAGGVLEDETAAGRLADLIARQSNQKLEVTKDDANEVTNISGKSEILVYRIELEHK